jgi:hypothetical protein
LPAGLAEVLWVDRFVEAVRDGTPLESGLEEVSRAVGWLRAARRSADEGQSVALESVSG